MARRKLQPSEPGLFDDGAGKHPALALLEDPQRVARVLTAPRFSAELPFFYHTSNSKALKRPIRFVDLDDHGREIRWFVQPDAEYGPANTFAHEVFHRLWIPAIDDSRDPVTGVPKRIVPLGLIEDCFEQLRERGHKWTHGKWQSEVLFTAFKQICRALCTARFYMPTAEFDDRGNRIFEWIETSDYQRFTLYKVGRGGGATRLQLADEIDDRKCTLYVELSSTEMLMQTRQPRYPLDLQFLFSLKPKSRRAYELLAPRVYGCVRHGERSFRLDYSWYVQAHHTLGENKTRTDIGKQMRETWEELIQIGYLERVEVEEVREGRSKRFQLVVHLGRYAAESIHAVARAIGQPVPGDGAPRLALAGAPAREPVPSVAARALADQLAERGIDRAKAERFAADLDEDALRRAASKVVDFDARLRRNEIGRNPAGYLWRMITPRTKAAPARAAGPAETVEEAPPARKATRASAGAARVWEELREEVLGSALEASKTGRVVYDTWVAPLAALGLEGGELTLQAPNATFVRWLAKPGAIGDTLRERAAARGLTVRVIV